MLSVQTSRFSETDCPQRYLTAQAGCRLPSDLGCNKPPFVPGSRTCYRVVSHDRAVLSQCKRAWWYVIVERCNVVVADANRHLRWTDISSHTRIRSAISIACDVARSSWTLTSSISPRTAARVPHKGQDIIMCARSIWARYRAKCTTNIWDTNKVDSLQSQSYLKWYRDINRSYYMISKLTL